MNNNFTFDFYRQIFEFAIKKKYKIITLKDFYSNNFNKNSKILINRIDVDVKIDRLNIIYDIFKKLNIKASIFLRLHSPFYNLLTIGNIKIIQNIIEIGCEIGLHTELEDIYGYCKIDKSRLFRKELELFKLLFNTKIFGTASHGDITHFNNIDFWKNKSPNDFGLLYEAYDNKLMNNCRYISDSEWIRWKSYENGKLMENDRRTPIEHMADNIRKIYLLTHPESWYKDYIYE